MGRLLAAIWLLTLVGCAPSSSRASLDQLPAQVTTTPDLTAPPEEVIAPPQLQTGIVTLAGRSYDVELALTPLQQQQGLMHRTELATNKGMLFVFSAEQPLAFWMKNTLIPLDILYFDAERKLVAVHHNVQPCQQDPCPTYSSGMPAQYVLELQAGQAAELGVELGVVLQVD